jgi:hypothetical protein
MRRSTPNGTAPPGRFWYRQPAGEPGHEEGWWVVLDQRVQLGPWPTPQAGAAGLRRLVRQAGGWPALLADAESHASSLRQRARGLARSLQAR